MAMRADRVIAIPGTGHQRRQNLFRAAFSTTRNRGVSHKEALRDTRQADAVVPCRL
jgi:hypothetical protein